MTTQEKKTDSSTSDTTVHLKSPRIAALLAWLVPGLGHLYQGRKTKALIYAICIWGLFLFGAMLASGKCGLARCVYISLRPGAGGDIRYYYFAQVWVGLPAFPALAQYLNDPAGENPLWNGLMAPPLRVTWETRGYSENDNSIDNIRKKLNRRFELGTLMTTMAGLLNIFAIFDALCGPVDEEEAEKKRHQKQEERRLKRRAKQQKKDAAEEI